jgi:hypothetical protein
VLAENEEAEVDRRLGMVDALESDYLWFVPEG